MNTILNLEKYHLRVLWALASQGGRIVKSCPLSLVGMLMACVSAFQAGVILFSVVFIGVGLAPGFAGAQIMFEEVAQEAGIYYSGHSCGASWGDYDGDGWADLWVSNHSQSPFLYRNNTDGTFTDITYVVEYEQDDMHGAAWADFDNDGDKDLIQLVGGADGAGSGPNQFFISSGGLLQNRADEYGLSYPLGRGRTPLWFDWNGDNFLDVLLQNTERSDGMAPSTLFTQGDDSFINDGSLTGLAASINTWPAYAQMVSLTDENVPSLVLSGAPYPSGIYHYDILPFEDVTETTGLASVPEVWDTAIADFNGDLKPDFYMASFSAKSVVETLGSSVIRAAIIASGDEKGLQFRASGNVSFKIEPVFRITNEDIYIGSGGYNTGDNEFTLSSANEATWGIYNHTPGVDYGVFLGYDQSTGIWQIYVSKDSWIEADITINADVQISEVSTLGFSSYNGGTVDSLLIQTSEGFTDSTWASGLNIPTACGSVVAADFDNDMDVDIYLVCRSLISNLPNILYENMGDNTFKPVIAAGGAEGSMDGLGESVATADYDRDGFVDIFVTNGNGGSSFGIGPHQLFRNLGNENHWLEIDLEGVISNRDGIGTRLFVTAGGNTQLREQDGGMHSFAQDHGRIHFGMAGNLVAEELLVQWPSGIDQQFLDVDVDQVLHAVELDITGIPIDGSNVPLVVNFNGNVAGYYDAVSYAWDFDNDGQIDSTDQNPSHTYSSLGSYTVKLTVINSDGSVVTATRNDYVSICRPVRNIGSNAYFSRLQRAYNRAADGDIIQIKEYGFSGDFVVNQSKLIEFKAGYDNCNFEIFNGNTVINGNMIVSNGTLIIDSGTVEISDSQ